MSSLPAAPPTRTRYWVVVLAITLAVIQYIDRTAISQAKGAIATDFKFTDDQMGLIFGAFGLAYALFEIPTGWLGDKIGARKVLVRVVLWWSFFTAATGWVGYFVSSLGTSLSYRVMWWTRFLFGAGEAGCFPNLTRAFSSWLPKNERTRVQALMWMGARWGGAFTPLLVVVVMYFVNWKTAFQLFALLGVAWAIVFWLWFRDRPRDHKSVNAAELALLKDNEAEQHSHGGMPWGKLVSSPAMWLLWGQYFCLSYGWYFFVTWLPDYLNTSGRPILGNAFLKWVSEQMTAAAVPAQLIEPLLKAVLAGVPLFFGGFGSLLAGMVATKLIAGGTNVVTVRRSFGFGGLAGAAALLMTSFYIKDPLLAMLAMGMASFCNDLTMPGSWASCMDIGGKYAGTVSGSMNMMGNFGGLAGPVAVGYLLKYYTATNAAGVAVKNWFPVFAIASAIYFLGAFCWLFIDPVTPLEKRGEPTDAARV